MVPFAHSKVEMIRLKWRHLMSWTSTYTDEPLGWNLSRSSPWRFWWSIFTFYRNPSAIFINFLGPESCGIIKPPNVVSVSYGQDEVTVTAAFANRQCHEYGKVHCLISSKNDWNLLLAFSLDWWEHQCSTVVVTEVWQAVTAASTQLVSLIFDSFVHLSFRHRWTCTKWHCFQPSIPGTPWSPISASHIILRYSSGYMSLYYGGWSNTSQSKFYSKWPRGCMWTSYFLRRRVLEYLPVRL